MIEFTVVANNLELPSGARFTYQPRFPIETGALCLLSIGGLLTIGRYYHDIAGFDWIVQPGLLIQVAGKSIVEIWGQVMPLTVPSGFDRTIGSILLAAVTAIIEICNLSM